MCLRNPIGIGVPLILLERHVQLGNVLWKEQKGILLSTIVPTEGSRVIQCGIKVTIGIIVPIVIVIVRLLQDSVHGYMVRGATMGCHIDEILVFLFPQNCLQDMPVLRYPQGRCELVGQALVVIIIIVVVVINIRFLFVTRMRRRRRTLTMSLRLLLCVKE